MLSSNAQLVNRNPGEASVAYSEKTLLALLNRKLDSCRLF
jgi:hypothetical protein